MLTKEEYINFMLVHGCNVINWSNATNAKFERLTKGNGEEINKWHKELNNLLSKRYRIKEKIKSFQQAYFITLTIDEKNLKKIKSKRTYEDKIKEIFKGSNYIANEDYGKTNTKRLHYHVVCEDNTNLNKWTYGFTSKFKIRYGEDEQQIARYMTKLANHTLKEKGAKIIYGRKKRIKKDQNIKNTENN